jgi:hypothetical protein
MKLTEEILRREMRKAGYPSMMDIYFEIMDTRYPGISESIRRTEARWSFLARQIKVIESYERFFSQHVAWQSRR